MANPLDRLRYHVTGAIERGEGEPIAGIPAPTAERHPILHKLWTEGTVRIEGSDFVATAADGEVVAIGHVAYPDSAEAYLKSHPSPSDW